MVMVMPKIFYFLHLLCLLFALQTTAAEPAVTTTLLTAGNTVVSNIVDDSLSADFGEVSGNVDMLRIAEVDVDKIIVPAFNYPLNRSVHLAPEHQLPAYHLQLAFLLERPPQSA